MTIQYTECRKIKASTVYVDAFKMVGDIGLEPIASTTSRWHSTFELIAHITRYIVSQILSFFNIIYFFG